MDKHANFIGAVIGLLTPILFFLVFWQPPSTEGTTANASFDRSFTGFRFYSNPKSRMGRFVTPVIPPLKRRSVLDLLALPKGNKATCLTIVTIPKGENVQIREVASDNNRPGGWIEFELKQDELRKGWFSSGMRTPWAPKKTDASKC